MGIKGPALGMALAASMGACDSSKTADLATQESALNAAFDGLEIPRFTLADSENLSDPRSPDRIMENAQSRNRTQVFATDENGRVLLDEQGEEITFDLEWTTNRNGQVYWQNCPTGPDQCLQAPVLLDGSPGATGRSVITFQVPDANDPGVLNNKILIASSIYDLRVGRDGIPHMDLQSFVDLPISSSSYTPLRSEVGGRLLTTHIMTAGIVGDIHVHNLLDRTSVTIFEDVNARAGVTQCGTATPPLRHDYDLRAEGNTKCRIIMDELDENGVVQGTFMLPFRGADPRLMEINGVTYLTYKDEQNQIQVRNVLEYCGNDVCAEGENGVCAEDCQIAPPMDAGVPEDMNVPPADAATPDAATPDMGAGGAMAPDAGMGGSAGEGGAGGQGGEGGQGGSPEADMGVVQDAEVIPDAAAPDANVTPDMGAGGQGGEGGQGGSPEADAATPDAAVPDAGQDARVDVGSDENCKPEIAGAIEMLENNAKCTLSVCGKEGTYDVTVQPEGSDARCHFKIEGAQFDLTAANGSEVDFTCEVSLGADKQVCYRGEDTINSLIEDGVRVQTGRVLEDGGTVFTGQTLSKRKEYEEKAPRLGGDGQVMKSGDGKTLYDPVLVIEALEGDGESVFSRGVTVSFKEGEMLKINLRTAEEASRAPLRPAPIVPPTTEAGPGGGEGCGCDFSNTSSSPGAMIMLALAGLFRRRKK